MQDEINQDAGHTWPKTTPCEIHLVSLGLRHLEPFGLGDVTSPSYLVLAPNFPDRKLKISVQKCLKMILKVLRMYF